MTAARGRPASAPIEFVMVWPMLLMMVAGIFLMSRAGIAKEAAATAARNKTWAERPKAKPGKIFEVTHDPIDSRVDADATVRVASGPLFRNAFQAKSRSFTIDRVWNHREVPFERLDNVQIHKEPLRRLTNSLDAILPGGNDVLVETLAAMAFALDPDRNPVLQAAALARFVNPVVRVAGVVLGAIGNVPVLNIGGYNFRNLERASRGHSVQDP